MLNNFSSIFEILAALNLGYAGSETFRETIDDKILRLKNTISYNHKTKISQIRNEIKVTIAEEYEEKIKQKCIFMERYFNISVKHIESVEKEASDFPKGIKSIFLIVSIYCFFMLIFGGYAQFYTAKDNNSLLAFLNLTSIPIFVFFIRNLVHKHRNNNVRPIYAVFFFISTIVLYILTFHLINDKYFPSERTNILIAILIGFSAFLFHFLRVFAHRVYFRYQLFSVYSGTKKELKKIEQSISLIKQNGNSIKKHSSLIQILINIWNAIRKEKSH